MADEITLGQVLDEEGGDIQTGPFGTKLTAAEYTPEGVPVISVGEVGYGRLRTHTKTPRVDESVTGRMPEYLLRAGDIVFGRKGAVDRSALVLPEQDGWFLGSDGIRIRLPQSCDAAFMSYQLLEQRHRNWIIQHAAGTTMASLNEGIIRSIPVVLPPLAEQRAVAGVLGSLDDKIEQNRLTAGKLEELARAVFRAWFVDFAPVHAKASGATTYPGLPQQAFDALPNTFEDSPLGPIPKGWEVKPLDKVADFLNGLALQKYPPREDGTDLPVIKIAQLRKGSTEGAGAANDSIADKYKIKDRDILFSWSGTLEAVFWFGGPGALNQHLFKVTSDDYPDWLVYEWIHQHLAEFRLIASSKATTMGHIKRGHLSQALVATPPDDFLREADKVMRPIFDLHANANLESKKLAELRDYLLPRLLSGTVRVREAEAMTEGVL